MRLTFSEECCVLLFFFCFSSPTSFLIEFSAPWNVTNVTRVARLFRDNDEKPGFFGKGSRAHRQCCYPNWWALRCCWEVTMKETLGNKRWRCASHNSSLRSWTCGAQTTSEPGFSRTGFLCNTWTDPDTTSFSVPAQQIGLYIYDYRREDLLCSCVFSEWLHFWRVPLSLFFFRMLFFSSG